MRISGFDVLVFVAEMAVYVAVGWAGLRLHPILCLAGPLLMAVWWGLLHSPKAPVPLPAAVDLGLRSAWFAVGLVCAVRLAR